MPRDDNIGADTSGRSGRIGGSTSGGKAGDEQFNAYGEDVRDDANPISEEDARNADPDQLQGTPEDLKLGKRRTVGMEEDPDDGQLDESRVQDSDAGV